MPSTRQELLDAALGLPEPERGFIVQGLLDSLGPDEASAKDEISIAELDRRLAEFEQGQAGEISWNELRKQK